MGWLDCLKPASFDECPLKPIISPFWVFDLPGVPDPTKSDDEEGLWGYENEAKVLIFLGLGYGLLRVIR